MWRALLLTLVLPAANAFVSTPRVSVRAMPRMTAAPAPKSRFSRARGAVAGAGTSLLGRLRGKRTLELPAQITINQTIPAVDVLFNGTAISADELFSGKRAILVGLPGAFTPTCSDEHMPGFMKKAGEFAEKEIDFVAAVAINDQFVMDAWSKSLEECVGIENPLLMISDGDQDFSRALGMLEDKGFGMGPRTKRFAMLVDNGVVQHVSVDDGELRATSAEAMMKVVDPETVDDGTSADANAQLGLALVVAAGVVFAAKPDLFSGP